MKLINYRCPICGQEEEKFLDSEELANKKDKIPCSCGGEKEEFNFTNNRTIQKFEW